MSRLDGARLVCHGKKSFLHSCQERHRRILSGRWPDQIRVSGNHFGNNVGFFNFSSSTNVSTSTNVLTNKSLFKSSENITSSGDISTSSALVTNRTQWQNSYMKEMESRVLSPSSHKKGYKISTFSFPPVNSRNALTNLIQMKNTKIF